MRSPLTEKAWQYIYNALCVVIIGLLCLGLYWVFSELARSGYVK